MGAGFEDDLSEFVEFTSQLSETIAASLCISFGDDDIRKMTECQPKHYWRPSPTPDISGGLVSSPDMLLDITEKRGNPSLSDRVGCLEGSLNEKIYGRAVLAAKVIERGMAACCEGMALVVKARAEGALRGIETILWIVDSFG